MIAIMQLHELARVLAGTAPCSPRVFIGHWGLHRLEGAYFFLFCSVQSVAARGSFLQTWKLPQQLPSLVGRCMSATMLFSEAAFEFGVPTSVLSMV